MNRAGRVGLVLALTAGTALGVACGQAARAAPGGDDDETIAELAARVGPDLEKIGGPGTKVSVAGEDELTVAASGEGAFYLRLLVRDPRRDGVALKVVATGAGGPPPTPGDAARTAAIIEPVVTRLAGVASVAADAKGRIVLGVESAPPERVRALRALLREKVAGHPLAIEAKMEEPKGSER